MSIINVYQKQFFLKDLPGSTERFDVLLKIKNVFIQITNILPQALQQHAINILRIMLYPQLHVQKRNRFLILFLIQEVLDMGNV